MIERHLTASMDALAEATATNATATATINAPADQRYTLYITQVSISFSAAPATSLLAELKDGATRKFGWQLPAAAQSPLVVNFGLHPLKITPGNNAVLTVPAAGAGVTSHIVLAGFVASA